MMHSHTYIKITNLHNPRQYHLSKREQLPEHKLYWSKSIL